MQQIFYFFNQYRDYTIPVVIAKGRAGGIAIVKRSSHLITKVSGLSYLIEILISDKIPMQAMAPKAAQNIRASL